MNLSRNVTKRGSDELTVQEETFPAAEKILSDIENVLKKDTELASFEIIPVQDNENKSPVYHEEHSLGLASWCVQPLYCYAYGRLVDLRRSDHRREESSTISRWLTGALLLNPDISTFWNMKRELVRNGRLDALGELRFSTVVLYYRAKCFEAFAYRRWILQYLLVGGKSTSSEMETLLDNEIRIAGISADRYANNYHAWSHREYVTASWEKHLSDTYDNFLKNDWDVSGKWCNRHVSDHSGLAYRQFLLNRLLFERSNDVTSAPITNNELSKRRKLIKRFVTWIVPKDGTHLSSTSEESWEFLNVLHRTKVTKRDDVDYDRVLVALSYWAEDSKNNETDILSYPGHEALWYHRRFLADALVTLENSYARHRRYQIDDIAAHRSRHEYHRDSGDSKRIRERSTNEEPDDSGLLSIAFHRDNERIIKIAQRSKDEPQTTLSGKFVKYIREFIFDSSNDEGR